MSDVDCSQYPIFPCVCRARSMGSFSRHLETTKAALYSPRFLSSRNLNELSDRT